MNPITRFSLATALVLSVATAGADPAGSGKLEAPSFETLKQLAGEWQIVDASGKISGTTRYQVTSAGSAVVETMLVGGPEEMVTIYTRDGDELAVTHYCAGGNQPRLASTPVKVPNQLKFDFKSAGNLKSLQDAHMHSLTVTFIDENHVRQEWVSYANGKAAETMVFNLTRKT